MGYENAPFHERWYNFLQYEFSPLKFYPNRKKKHLQLWPRGHGKSTTTDFNYLSWIIGNNHNIHTNVVSKTASLSEDINLALMTRMENDDKYIELFKELKPKNPKKWTTKEIIVERNEISKNPTVKATGLMGPITGGRSDLIICDDIIDEENVRTDLQMEKVSTWFNKVLYPTLYPWGAIIVIGTRWHYADLYSELLQHWEHSVLKAVQPDGTALWSEYWSLERLEERKREIGTIIFNCQYQNDPTGMEGDLLKSEWLQSWTQPPLPTRIKYAAIDPALGEGDLQAVAILSQDVASGQVFLEDVWADTLPFPMFLKKIEQLHGTYHFQKIYVEANAFQKVLLFVPELGGLPTVPSQTERDKVKRFISMSSHFESGRILINPLLQRRSEFWTEWVQFPRGQHDDALDAVEIGVRNMVGAPRGFWT